MSDIKQVGSLKLTSSAFADNQTIPTKFTCNGQNINPPLNIENVPDEAKSLALVMHDPDAVSGDFVHWLAWNISPNTSDLLENSLPNNAILGKTSFGKTQYGGPCPPTKTGVHHYVFELYALDSELALPAGSGRDQLLSTIKGRIISQTTLVGLVDSGK